MNEDTALKVNTPVPYFTKSHDSEYHRMSWGLVIDNEILGLIVKDKSDPIGTRYIAYLCKYRNIDPYEYVQNYSLLYNNITNNDNIMILTTADFRGKDRLIKAKQWVAKVVNDYRSSGGGY